MGDAAGKIAPFQSTEVTFLVWRHQLLGQPVFELQMAVGDADIVRAKLAIWTYLRIPCMIAELADLINSDFGKIG